MSTDLPYWLAGLGAAFLVTLGLRALPFVVLEPLRESRLVAALAHWMPAGLLAILAAATFSSASTGDGGQFVRAGVAAVVTVAVHLGLGRRMLLSVAAGTACFVALQYVS